MGRENSFCDSKGNSIYVNLPEAFESTVLLPPPRFGQVTDREQSQERHHQH